MTKEEIYDAKLSPLIAQVIEICREHKIAHVMTFSLDPERGLLCTTCDVSDECEPPGMFEMFVKVMFPEDRPALTVTTTKEDGSKICTVLP